jgi:hypothetical protein
MMFMTFTPLKGRSSVVIRFLDEPSEDRGVIAMTIEDALHIPPEERQKIIAAFLPHEREARARGVPMLGSGRIFMTPESITEPPIEYIPALGEAVGHRLRHRASVRRGADPVGPRQRRDPRPPRLPGADALPIQHAHAMKQIGAAVPVAWPKDGADREKSSGEPLAKLAYKKHDLKMLPSTRPGPTAACRPRPASSRWTSG